MSKVHRILQENNKTTENMTLQNHGREQITAM